MTKRSTTTSTRRKRSRKPTVRVAKGGQNPNHNTDGTFAKGHPKYGGNAKGSKHHFTQLKDQFLGALEDMGGQKFIKRTLGQNPVDVLRMIAQMLPRHTDVSGEVDVGPAIEVHFHSPDEDKKTGGK